MTLPPRRQDSERIEVQFLTSAPSLRLCPEDAEPEIAVAGRSNAGKSSVLNRLTGSRHTAKVSKTPGRTQLLNLFSVRGGGRLVDLPGYGYAKADRSAQARWQSAVNEYLEGRRNLVGLVIVMDIRHPLQTLDQELVRWAAAAGLPLLLLLNKADKLSYGAQQQTLQQVRAALRSQGIPPGAATVVTFSALRGLNVDPVIQTLRDWLARHAAPADAVESLPDSLPD
jgi:GTP-binding protein